MAIATPKNRVARLATFSILAFGLLAGCESAADKALDQAKARAASMNTPQQIQYVDKNGDTVTTVVQPPIAGQPQQISTTTAPPPPGPPPHSTRPIITPWTGAGYPAGQPYVPTPPNADQTSPSSPTAVLNGGSTTQPGAPGYPAATPPGQGGPAAYNLTVPAGTELAVRVNERIDVKHAAPGQHFSGEIVEPIQQNGAIVIPRGTAVRGRIDEAHRRGHFKGRSILELRLVAMTLNGNEYQLDTRDTVRTKKGKGKRSTAFIGGLTGAGMLIGGLASGGVGLAIGGASGAGAGTLLAGATGNRDIVIPAETVVHFRLADQLVVQNP